MIKSYTKVTLMKVEQARNIEIDYHWLNNVDSKRDCNIYLMIMGIVWKYLAIYDEYHSRAI